MKYETLSVERDERGVVSLTLNLPEKRNAISARMIAELTDFAERSNADTTIRAMVLSGAGSVFCACGDLDWMMARLMPTARRGSRRRARWRTCSRRSTHCVHL